MSVIDEISAERRRQIENELFSAQHDDGYAPGVLGRAAVCYAQSAIVGFAMPPRASGAEAFPTDDLGLTPSYWPWSAEWWKPKDARRDLIRAAALIVAEIERLDRASARP